MSETRHAALRLLVEWDERWGVFIDQLLHEYLREHEMEPRDRAHLAELCYGGVRHRSTLHAVSRHYAHRSLDRSPRSTRNALALGLYQHIYLQTPSHAVVSTSVDAWDKCFGRDHAPGERQSLKNFLNATLRRACEEITVLDDSPKHLDSPDTVLGACSADEDKSAPWVKVPRLGLPARHVNLPEMLGIKFSHPSDVVRMWLERMGEEQTIAVMRWNNVPPRTSIVLRAGVKPENYLRKLGLGGIASEDTGDPAVYRLNKPGPIERLPGYGSGEFWVQDGNARRLALMLPKKEEGSLLDLCSAPGGKLATYLDRAPIKSAVACDVSGPRLDQMRENLERLGLMDIRKVEIKKVDEDPTRLRLEREFDQITVDVPCSNSGVLARRHEARWRILPEKIRQLQQLQTKLLRAAASHLKRGGDLLYTTCSIEPTENEQVVQSVLQSNPDLRMVEERLILPGDESGDGGYGALLRRAEF